MFTRIKGPWDALGVMLALIALYLVLRNSKGASQLASSGSYAGVRIFKTLQGR